MIRCCWVLEGEWVVCFKVGKNEKGGSPCQLTSVLHLLILCLSYSIFYPTGIISTQKSWGEPLFNGSIFSFWGNAENTQRVYKYMALERKVFPSYRQHGKTRERKCVHTSHNYTSCCYLQNYHTQKAFCNQWLGGGTPDAGFTRRFLFTSVWQWPQRKHCLWKWCHY